MPSTTSENSLFHRDADYSYPVVVRGEGIYLFDENGKRYIDGGAGAGNVTLGHGRERIANVLADQAKTLAYCFSAYFTNRLALTLAERVTKVAPGDLNHVYFVSGGSEGIETALKIARQYQVQRGQTQKQKVIARWRSYHGASLGALSCTGIPSMRSHFAPWLADFPHIPPCYSYRCELAGCEGTCNLTCADELERAIIHEGPENVAAFIAEPIVQGHVAAAVPPPDYFKRIREICDRYDVLLILDEVITAFGRMGKYFAIEHFDVVPDIAVFAKAISSGYCPLGGVVFSDKIAESYASSGKPFAHVFTYVNNPLAMRVGLEVLDIMEEEKILEHVTEVGAYLQQKSREVLSQHSCVGEIRGLGLSLGVELVRDRATKEPFETSQNVSKILGQLLLDRGLSMSAVGGVADFTRGEDIRFNPPLIITHEQIDEALDIMDESLTELEGKLGV